MGGRQRKLFWLAPLAWLAFSLAVAGTMMWIAWHNSPVGEFYDPETSAIHWKYWLAIGVGWFALVGVVPIVVFSAIAWAVNRRSPRSAPDAA